MRKQADLSRSLGSLSWKMTLSGTTEGEEIGQEVYRGKRFEIIIVKEGDAN